jgi:hypothetical protein
MLVTSHVQVLLRAGNRSAVWSQAGELLPAHTCAIYTQPPVPALLSLAPKGHNHLLSSACGAQFLGLYCTAGIAASLSHVAWFWYKAVREGKEDCPMCSVGMPLAAAL